MKTAVFAMCLSSASALAAATAPGAVCQKAANLITGQGGNGSISYFGGAIFGAGFDNLVTCPITNGTTLGTDIRFRIYVNNNHSTESFSCQGFAKVPNIGTTLTTPVLSVGSGAHTLASTISPLPQGFSTSAAQYWVDCTIPSPNGFAFSSIIQITID